MEWIRCMVVSLCFGGTRYRLTDGDTGASTCHLSNTTNSPTNASRQHSNMPRSERRDSSLIDRVIMITKHNLITNQTPTLNPVHPPHAPSSPRLNSRPKHPSLDPNIHLKDPLLTRRPQRPPIRTHRQPRRLHAHLSCITRPHLLHLLQLRPPQ